MRHGDHIVDSVRRAIRRDVYCVEPFADPLHNLTERFASVRSGVGIVRPGCQCVGRLRGEIVEALASPLAVVNIRKRGVHLRSEAERQGRFARAGGGADECACIVGKRQARSRCLRFAEAASVERIVGGKAARAHGRGRRMADQ